MFITFCNTHTTLGKTEKRGKQTTFRACLRNFSTNFVGNKI